METPIPELLAGYALGDLTPEELAFLEDYLQTHPEAHQEISALQQTLAFVPLALPEPVPQLRRKLVKPPLLRAAVATILIAVGCLLMAGQNYQMRQQIVQLQQAMELPDNRIIGLNPLHVSHQSMGSLLIAPRMAKGILSIQNLPPPPRGKKYTLWIVDQNGKKVFCQQFVPDRGGRVMVMVPIDPSMVYTSEVAITIEDEDNNTSPRGPMVIQGRVI